MQQHKNEKLAQEEENGITIVQLSRLMNCRKAALGDLRQAFSHVIVRTFMADDIRRDNKLRKATKENWRRERKNFDTKTEILI